MALRSVYPFGVLKAVTIGLLGALLVFLGSSAYHASVGAYVSFFGILLLQGIEVFYPLLSKDGEDTKRHMAILRASILLQLLLASVLVAFTDGSGSIYELVYLLPIISAATKLPGRDVAFVVGSAVVAMIGFIVTGEELTASIARVKAFQDAVAATTYFTMAGILTYLFAKDEREQRQHYQAMAEALARTNAELRLVQTELTERLVQVTQMEERIQRTGQMAALGELAGQVAHEVRNPLGIIKGATEMLAARISDPSIQRHISVLLEEVDRLNHAVEGILRLGTPLRIQTSPLHLQDLLRSVTQSVAAATDGSVVVSLDLPDTPIRINGDRELLHHALTNLVRNGYQAMPSGGCLTVSARVRATGEDLTVLIADTGVGLPAEDLKRLGEPFFTKRPGGVGLGFALARRIIVEHAGTVDVRSAPGLGTTITIQLPVQRFQPAGLAAMETKDRR